MSSLVFDVIRKLDRILWRLSWAVGVATLAGMTWRLFHNLRFWRRARRYQQLPDSPPLVSILVPARDEKTSINACITSLARQDYPHFEIIALDDQSTDGTGVQLDGLAKRFECLRVIHSTDSPPSGWNGKSYACHRLARQARGDWLLFTDADTRHTPQSVRLGIA
ncbi:MAG: glycosyltransferase, partial [Chloroflexi bacterium]